MGPNRGNLAPLKNPVSELQLEPPVLQFDPPILRPAEDPPHSPSRGEMARRFREFDWSTTPLGPPEHWPESWRNAVQIILDSSFPTALAIGNELIYFYNDAFIPLAGATRHQSSMGLPVPIAWKEIWEDILASRFHHTLTTGEPTGEADLLMPLERSGYLEETFITFSFAALRDADNRPNGIFCTAIETTARIIAERQMSCLRALASRSSFADTPELACQSAVATLEANPRDLPFVLLYLLDADGTSARLAGTAGLLATPASVPLRVDLSRDKDIWPLAQVAESHSIVTVENVHALIKDVIRTPEVAPNRALALPISSPGAEHLAGILIAGVNPMRPVEETRAFHEMIAGQLETAISSARAKQHVRERAQALAELDRAKTVFFSNISHELRTPLTLLLSPMDDVLERATLAPEVRELLQTAVRGGRRLQKLVNSLLEFSRIEAGRIDARYEPTDLAAMTADLSSEYRSAFERAGIGLTIDCPKLPEDVFVDHDMWEKIVLNLVSNAFKFTLKGAVHVSQRAFADHIQLQVRDTGCGVAPEELPRLFERFFRGRSQESRTHEGSGIGLSLVHELVKLHGGHIEANSRLGEGMTVSVQIPRGCTHLPKDRISTPRTLERTRTTPQSFVEEALGWLPDSAERLIEDRVAAAEIASSTSASNPAIPPRILVVDDNADMRNYLRKLLSERWLVETASDGYTALESIQRHAPDLVVADVMMPGMDGFGLVRKIRSKEATADLQVMLLSARAGEEASAEGLRAGADDYVIKPFKTADLLARVSTRIGQARQRAEERRAREIAEKANLARDEFFTILSHELRTPLTAVLSWVGLLKNNKVPPGEIAQAVELIERNARAQRRLVDDLLDISHIITGRLRIEPRAIPSLSGVIAWVVDLFHPVAAAKGLTLETALAESGPLRGDPERLQQVIWNLMSNAIRYTPGGGRITVRFGRENDYARLDIQDSGQGIDADALPRVFERYWQGRDGSRATQGMGLGLTIARRIVELHDGQICATSPGSGQGATFTVRLPLGAATTAPIATGTPAFDPPAAGLVNERILDAVTAELEMEAQTDGEGTLRATGFAPENGRSADALHILLVEDHNGIAKACERLLASHGHSVVRAAGVKTALAAAERQLFDLIICDLCLPDGSGLELLPKVRACLKSATDSGPLPAIAISGRVHEDDVALSREAGFALHLAKPFDEEKLIAAMRKVARR